MALIAVGDFASLGARRRLHSRAERISSLTSKASDFILSLVEESIVLCAVKTSPFHGGYMGSNPVGVTKKKAFDESQEPFSMKAPCGLMKE